jgi:glycine/serine hydroxymethyltransferase
MKQEQMVAIGRLISAALRQRDDERVLKDVSATVDELVRGFPAYPEDFAGHV